MLGVAKCARDGRGEVSSRAELDVAALRRGAKKADALEGVTLPLIVSLLDDELPACTSGGACVYRLLLSSREEEDGIDGSLGEYRWIVRLPCWEGVCGVTGNSSLAFAVGGCKSPGDVGGVVSAILTRLLLGVAEEEEGVQGCHREEGGEAGLRW